MVRRWFLVLPFLLLLGAFRSAHAENSHTDGDKLNPAPTERRVMDEAAKVESVDDLKKTLREGNIADNWWAAAHKLLGKISQKDAETFATELSAGPRRDLFTALVKFRFIDDPTKIRDTARSATGSPERDAARQELKRRLDDPNTKLIARIAHMRPERAMIVAGKILKAIQAKDVKAAAKEIAKLMGELNRVQREALKKVTDELLPKVKDLGLDETLVKWLNGAAKVSLDEEPKTAFEKAFKPEYNEVLKKNKAFHEKVARAIDGDKQAKQELLHDYDPEAVMDFIAAQLASKNDGVAVDVARAFSREGDGGNLFLDLSAANGFFKDGAARNQSLVLGKKDQLDEIKAALNAFAKGGVEDHGEIETGFDPGTVNRFQRFTLNPRAATQDPVHVFAGVKDGKPWLGRTTDAGRPKEDLAREAIRWPNTPSQNPDGDNGGTQSTIKDNGTKKPISDEVAKNMLKQQCMGCHDTPKGGFQLTDADLNNKAKLTAALKSLFRDKKNAGTPMPKGNEKFRDTPDGQKLIQWLEAVTGTKAP